MKKTSLYDRHVALGGKFVTFAGYQLPIQYIGINREHKAVRTAAGLFDVSHMGEFFITGKDAEAFINRMTINDVASLKAGQAQYSAFCNDDGGIIDDIIVYRFENKFMLVVNGTNREKDLNWLQSHINGEVSCEDVSDKTGLLALQGPKSRKILTSLTDTDIEALPFYSFQKGKVCGIETFLARTGYTGELGFELYAQPDFLGEIWDGLMEAGKPHGLLPAGLGCRDTLRMEMKYSLYGNDIDESTNPVEAGLGWATKMNKGYFMGRKAIITAKEKKTRRLVCFEMVDRAIPRKGYEITSEDLVVGFVTSGTQSPTLGKGIGMGYVNINHVKSGTKLGILIRGKTFDAIIIKAPLYKEGTLYT